MKRKIINEKNLKLYSSDFVKKDCQICFDEQIAKRYLPIIYENEGYSGDPLAVYYRIVIKDKPTEFCIQYYYYWKRQRCLPPHNHDYEPIFVYLEPFDYFPLKIVNGGYSLIKFHKNEIRPRNDKRSRSLEKKRVKITKSPYYPFGKYEKKMKEVYYKIYPLNSGKDLTFHRYRPKFGIIVCSNVFSGAKTALKGRKLNPPLKKLSDSVLKRWYFDHYKTYEDMPFGHDVASPFTFPHINYRDARPHLPKPKKIF